MGNTIGDKIVNAWLAIQALLFATLLLGIKFTAVHSILAFICMAANIYFLFRPKKEKK